MEAKKKKGAGSTSCSHPPTKKLRLEESGESSKRPLGARELRALGLGEVFTSPSPFPPAPQGTSLRGPGLEADAAGPQAVSQSERGKGGLLRESAAVTSLPGPASTLGFPLPPSDAEVLFTFAPELNPQAAPLLQGSAPSRSPVPSDDRGSVLPGTAWGSQPRVMGGGPSEAAAREGSTLDQQAPRQDGAAPSQPASQPLVQPAFGLGVWPQSTGSLAPAVFAPNAPFPTRSATSLSLPIWFQQQQQQQFQQQQLALAQNLAQVQQLTLALQGALGGLPNYGPPDLHGIQCSPAPYQHAGWG